MRPFNFNEDVIIEVVQKMLTNYDLSDIKHEGEEKMFTKIAIEIISQNKSLSPDILVDRVGFSDETSIQAFLHEPTIFAEIQKKVIIPSERMSDELIQRLQTTYEVARRKQNETPDEKTATLLTLFDIFELIKMLTDEEITIINKMLPSYATTYFNNHTLQNFRDDLNSVDTDPQSKSGINLLAFEEKYKDCYSGLLENFIKPLLDAENLYRQIEEIRNNKTLENLEGGTIQSQKSAGPANKHSEAESLMKHSFFKISVKEDLTEIKNASVNNSDPKL